MDRRKIIRPVGLVAPSTLFLHSLVIGSKSTTADVATINVDLTLDLSVPLQENEFY